MKKYGVNWLLVFVALFLLLGVPHLWTDYLEQCFRPPHVPWSTYRWVFRVFDYPFGWTTVSFFVTRMLANHKEKALRTPEGQGEKVTANTASSAIVSKPLPLRSVLISAYGVVSAVVGCASLAAHLITGRVSAWEVVAMSVIVPLCIVIGGYLLTRVKGRATPTALQTENAAVAAALTIPTLEATANAMEPEVVTVGVGRWKKGELRR